MKIVHLYFQYFFISERISGRKEWSWKSTLEAQELVYDLKICIDFLISCPECSLAQSNLYRLLCPTAHSFIDNRSSVTCCMYRYWPVFILFAHLVLNQFMREHLCNRPTPSLLPWHHPSFLSVPHLQDAYGCLNSDVHTPSTSFTRETNENLMQQIKRMENSHNFSKTGKDSLKKKSVAIDIHLTSLIDMLYEKPLSKLRRRMMDGRTN